MSVTPLMWARTIGTLAFVPVMVMGLGGDVRWVQGWLFSAWFVLFCTSVIVWLQRNNPALLVERHRKLGTGGQSARDRITTTIIVIGYFVWMALMPLDARRWHMSPPFPAIVSGAGAVLIGVASFFLLRAFTDNTFLSPLVRIQDEQRVVTTGVYGFVRHPMYLGALALFVGAPLLLGSFVGLALSGVLSLVMVARIYDEERVLVEALRGYDDYRKKVRWRLIPYVF